MDRFRQDGRWIIPLGKRDPAPDKEKTVRYAVTEAYCPNGHNLIDPEHPVNGYPGIRLRFKRPGAEGEFILSAIEGDFDKIILSGELEDGVKDDLFCHRCGVKFHSLIKCNCCPDADMVVLGLTPKLDFNNAITFCNATGCPNGAFVKSGEVIRHIRLSSPF